MAEQDFFKEIAMTKHPSRTADREIAPAPLPDTIFQAGEEAAPELFADTEASFEDRREWFFAELDQMRERFRPFMRDLLPDLPETVKTYPLEDFAFRYLDRHEREIFSGSRKSGWEEVKIPDYRGPAGENGKWRGCYRCVFFFAGGGPGAAREGTPRRSRFSVRGLYRPDLCERVLCGKSRRVFCAFFF